MNKGLQILILMLVGGGLLPAGAQNGSIRGKIESSDGAPVEYVNVSLKGTLKGTTTNRLGEYEIRNVPPGQYTLAASLIGLEKREQQVNIAGGESLNVNFVLEETSLQLSEVTIYEKRNNQLYVDSSFIVSKLPLRNLENPQVYMSLPQQLLRDQVVTNFNDALKNAPGVTRLWESTGRGGDGAEYYTMRGFAVQPTLVNGMPSVNNAGLDPANIETIDVVKGPSGTLFGSPLISYGGLINITTKRPHNTLGGSLGIITGSNGLLRFTADLNLPVDQRTFTRINTAYHSENSFQDAGFNKSFFLAPSFTFQSSDRLTFHVNTEFLIKETVNAPMIFLNRYAPLTFNNIKTFENHYEKSFTSNDLSIKNPSVGLQAQAIYKINGYWTSQTVLSASSTRTNGYYHYLWDLSDGNTFARYISNRNGQTNTVDAQQNFIGDFKLGKSRNRLLVGFDFFKSSILNSSTGWVGNGEVTLNDGADTGTLTRIGVDALLVDSFEGNSNAESKVVSAYVSDVINITPQLSALASVRIDRFEGRTDYWVQEEVKSQTSVSPKFGLLYQLIPEKVSFFGNYLNGFINVAPAQVADLDGSNPRMKTFDPEFANQYEGGVKTNLYKDKVAATASYYSITVKNRVMSDPENVNNSIQGGEVQSQGIEFSVVANPIDGLNLVAGFSDNRSEITRDNPGDGYLGLRPEEAGPQTLINFWVNYTIPSGIIRGLGIGFGGNSASEHKTLNRANTGTFILPPYSVLNAALSYSGQQYRITLKANNLTDERYYSGWSTVTPQNLRNIALSMDYRF